MGYRIVYDRKYVGNIIKTNNAEEKKSNACLTWLYLITAGIFLFATYMRYGSVLPLFLPGEPEVTMAAVMHFKDHITGGGSFVEAVTFFCRIILEAAI